MAQDSQTLAAENPSNSTSYTRQEIFAQATLWPGTVRTVVDDLTRLRLSDRLGGKRVMLTGAGTSAYAAEAIADAGIGKTFTPGDIGLVLAMIRAIEHGPGLATPAAQDAQQTSAQQLQPQQTA